MPFSPSSHTRYFATLPLPRHTLPCSASLLSCTHPTLRACQQPTWPLLSRAWTGGCLKRQRTSRRLVLRHLRSLVASTIGSMLLAGLDSRKPRSQVRPPFLSRRLGWEAIPVLQQCLLEVIVQMPRCHMDMPNDLLHLGQSIATSALNLITHNRLRHVRRLAEHSTALAQSAGGLQVGAQLWPTSCKLSCNTCYSKAMQKAPLGGHQLRCCPLWRPRLPASCKVLPH